MHFSCSQAITCFSVRDRTVNDQLSYLVDQDDKRLHDIELANRSVTDKMRDFFSTINFKNLSSGFNIMTTYIKKKFKQLRNYLAELMDVDVVHDSDNEDDDDDVEENKNDVQDDANVRDDDDQAADEKQIDDEDRLIVEVESEEAVNYDNSSSNEVINFNDEFNESIR
jgi:hypothetical protein